jgi:hypothetical protein
MALSGDPPMLHIFLVRPSAGRYGALKDAAFSDDDPAVAERA